MCYVERESFAAAHLVAAMQKGWLDDAPLWSDLRTYDGKPWRGVVDWIVGGIPCQPYSVAGQKTGSADERNLWPDLRRIIDECRPDGIFLENVPGIARYLWDVIGTELQGMGYRVEAGLFSAAATGAPHVRRRLFVMGIASGRHVPIASGRMAREVLSESRWHENADIVASPGRQFPNASSTGLQGFRRFQETESQPTVRGLYPPSADAQDEWSRVLAVMPENEPAFCRMVDGLASEMVDARAHRLRLVGNGVVPLVVADAWRVLGQRLNK